METRTTAGHPAAGCRSTPPADARPRPDRPRTPERLPLWHGGEDRRPPSGCAWCRVRRRDCSSTARRASAAPERCRPRRRSGAVVDRGRARSGAEIRVDPALLDERATRELMLLSQERRTIDLLNHRIRLHPGEMKRRIDAAAIVEPCAPPRTVERGAAQVREQIRGAVAAG